MTTFQKVIKFLAISLAIFLTVSIICGIIGTLSLFDELSDNEGTTDNVKAYPITSEVKNLKVEINAADFTIKQGELFSVESNLKHLKVEIYDGTLTIKEAKKFSSNYNEASLILTIPKDELLNKASITTGAGKLIIDCLSADEINLELGAGNVLIDNLVAIKDIDIDGGAGKITIISGTLNDLDLNMGVGQLNLTSKLTGENDFDLGIGESNITVIGNKEDYNLNIDKGIGTITVDGTNISGIKESAKTDNSIEINGGIGTINLKFN